MKNRKIVLFILISLFIVTNIVLYILIEKNSKQQIKLVLDSHTSKLETNFKILLHHLKITSDSAYKSTTNKKFLIDILSRIDENTTNQEKKILRDKLYKKLKDKYEILKSKGVFQYHFVLPNNESFLRMHKVKKFGDDLSNIRLDFKYVNDTKKPISGFTQGKTSHGFRFIYLIFSDTKYLGAMEVSFSSEILQEYLTNIVDLHTHFLVNKEIINVTQWERDDIKLEYLKSSEHKDFMITMTKNHTKKECVTDNKLKLKPIIKEIENRVKENKMFSLYTKNDNKIIVVSFYPVKNIYNKTVAWLVSYENSEYIKNIYTKDFFNKTIGLFIILFIFYFLYMILNQKYLLEKLVNEKTNSLSKLNRELEESEYEVTLINENLEEKIKEEISKSKKIQNELFKSERLASMGEMIGNIAHQWRQPLSVISTAASGIKLQKEFGSLTDDFLLNSCDIINDSTQYLSQTIEDFRHFTKDEKEFELSNLNDTIKSFLNLVKGFNKVNDIKIILELDKDIEVNGYQNELIQSLMNLYNNSKEIMEKRDIVDKYIFINTYVKNNLIIIKFKDSAGGIDTKILPKIFDPYFTTKHQSQGTGLGLHTVYNLIVNDMDGKIEVKNISYKYQNKNLKGVEFKIMFTNKRIDHED